MSKLELPVRAFIEDFCKRAFPNRDWSRGSAINDLVISSFAALMQPIRHEIDQIKVNGSITNWQFQRPADLDALAANWGKFRQTGGLSTGTVRLYFDSAADYSFTNLEFFSSDGTTFVLASPVKISATDLFANRLSDGTFFFDVLVQSSGVGSRYALPAGSIVGVRNTPPGIVRVENTQDFATTAPNESNFDVVNSMFKNVGMRNLVSRQSIRAPILDTFAGVLDLFIAGAGHPSMVRDLVTVLLPSGAAQIHQGGMADVWLNSNSVSKRQLTLGYLPTSGEIKIVSPTQAQAAELIFSFARGLLTLDGLFSDPDSIATVLDESVSVVFDVQDVPVSAFVLGQVGTNRAQIGVKDVLSGTQLLCVPGPNGFSPYFGDFTGLNFHNTSVQAGDYILFGGKYRRISKLSGEMIDLAPTVTQVQDFLYSGSALPAGTRSISLSSIDTVAKINDRLVFPLTSASGEYLVTSLASNVATFGRIEASGLVTSIGADVVHPTWQVYHFTAPAGARPLLPPDVGTSHYLYFAADAGYDQSKYFSIKEIIPGTTYTTIKVLDPTPLSPGYGTVVSVIAGLTGILPTDTTITVERDDGALLPQDSVQTYAVGHTLYTNVLQSVLTAGSSTLSALGIGAVAEVGDVVQFENVTVPPVDLQLTGGDGSRYSVVVTAVPTLDSVTFLPGVPVDILANTRFAVVRNSVQVAQGTVSAVSVPGKTFSLPSMPLGLGDGIGLIVKDPSNNYYVVNASTAGNVRTLQFKAPVLVRTLVFASGGYVPAQNSDLGRPVKQIDGASTYNGTLYDFDNSTRTWRVIPNGISDTFVDTVDSVVIIGSVATGVLSAPASAPASAGYVNAVPGDVGLLVRQGTYTGLLDSYDNVLYQWKVKPLSNADLFDSTTDETFVDLGGGIPTPAHGDGTLTVPAGPLELAGGTVTFVLNAAPAFVATDVIHFYSRFSRHAGMFDGDSFTVTSNGAINTAPFSGAVAGTHQLAVLIGDNLGLYDITRVNTYKLRVSGAPTPEFIRIPNAPVEQAFSLSIALPVGTTTIAQTGIGLWAYPGRVLKVGTPSGPKLFAVASINNANSIEIEATGLPFTIYPNQGFTWEVVEALHVPFWVVPKTALKSYRIFRTPNLGDLIESSVLGSFSNISPNNFSDNSIDFSALLANADFTNSDYVLLIDSGSQASVVELPIVSVVSTNTILLSGASFPVSETGVAYRVVRKNTSKAKEDWIEATVKATGDPKLTLTLSVPNGFDFTRYGSHELWDVIIEQHPTWITPGGWAFGDNWHMPRFTVASYNVSTKDLVINGASTAWTSTAGDAFNVGNGIRLAAGSKVRIALRAQDRAAASQLVGSALNTFNYYADAFFNLPIVKIVDVQLLDPNSLQPIRSVAHNLRVDDKGLRYSAKETNTLVVSDQAALLQPLRVTYITDSLIESVDTYLNQDDTRILNANQLAKRMETFSVSVSVSIRSTLSQTDLASIVASFINSHRSTQKLTKADLIKDLFDRPEVAYIDLATFVLSGSYYKANGVVEQHVNVQELFGAETACYLADTISITKL